jgi:hypothetical protein
MAEAFLKATMTDNSFEARGEALDACGQCATRSIEAESD